MIGKENMIYKILNSRKKSNISFYSIVFILLLCSRLFDIITTYLATPNLTMESNVMVRSLGLGWFRFIILNIAIILVFFLLFRFSWSKFMKIYPIRVRYGTQSPKELNEVLGYSSLNKHMNHRNIALEIGITLPIYVIITGYFQGVINIMIYLELIIFSFSSFLYLYPLIIGGVFGYISLYITKQILYPKHPWFTKKAHKIMMPKRVDVGCNLLK
jgi:hypothetical protein